MQDEIKFCKHHGETRFGLFKSGKYPSRWRCRRCLAEGVIKRRKKLKTIAIEYKGSACCRCGYDDLEFPEVFEFHHKDPSQKDFGIAAKGATMSEEKMKKELDKCDMYCANCHRIIHVLERQ